MSLRGLANSMTSVVNPNVVGVVALSSGYTTDSAGVRTPTYTYIQNVTMQMQPLTGRELQHLDGLNLQGILRAIYIEGSLEGVRRLQGRGGDMVQIEGSWWLVVQVLEPWNQSGWCKVAVSEQTNAPNVGQTP